MAKRKTSIDVGAEFERQAQVLLELIPGMRVERQSKVRGKNTDFMCTETTSFGVPRKIAVEAKNYAGTLTRAAAASIMNEYRPLIDDKAADLFLLVTSHGLSPGASALFDGNKFAHTTLDELFQKVFSPKALLTNMQSIFDAGALSKYFVSPKAQTVDLKFVSQNYALVYNPFIDFVLELRAARGHLSDLSHYENAWGTFNYERKLASLPKKYDALLFERVIQQREPEGTTDLFETVWSWVTDDKNEYGLALLGSYGTGKSSFAKSLAAESARQYIHGYSSRIPLLIELRDFGDHQSIQGLVTHELMNKHRVVNGSYPAFQKLNDAGRFLIILDGFDEMKVGMTAEAMLYNFRQIAELHCKQAKVILCGRPTLFDSDTEQTKILSGAYTGVSGHAGRYIQLPLAPLDLSASIDLIKKYVAATKPRAQRDLEQTIRQIERRASTDAEFKELLARPVHLPMLVALLPDNLVDLQTLNRAELYRAFIDKIIHETIAREVAKAPSQEMLKYDANVRRKFATSLAMLTFQQGGGGRSIRHADIPDEIFKAHQKKGETLEAVKRGLIAGCFLERKPPDLMYFAHKSFAEFLVASTLADKIHSRLPSSDAFKIKITPEILEFVIDLLNDDDIFYVVEDPSRHTQIFSALIRKKEFALTEIATRLLADSSIAHKWSRILAFSEWKAAYACVEFLELAALYKQNVFLFQKFLVQAANHREDIVAVNAFRLLRVSAPKQIRITEKLVGTARLALWQKNGWIKSDEDLASRAPKQ